MPLISVVSIAKDETELKKLADALSDQTYKDFEFVGSTKGTIPEAWNDAISRAKGEYIVFTETDARPLNNHWLEEISHHLERNVVLKGIEIRPTELDMCNLVADAQIFKQLQFDESFPVAEDTEFFVKLKRYNIPIKEVEAFPIIHKPSVSWKKTMSRAFTYGMMFSKIIYLNGTESFEPVLTTKTMHPVSNRIRIIVDNMLVLLGLMSGGIYYFFSLKLKR